MTTSIYILRLEGGHYYVGKSDNVMTRYEEHLAGSGAAWTRHYPPIALVRAIENASPFDEDKTVKEYMATYGIDKVRGGSYVTEVLTEAQTRHLQQELWAATNRCTRCGSTRHFIKDCNMIRRSGILYDAIPRPTVTTTATCYRCGRTGHYMASCYARTDLECYEIDDIKNDEDDEESNAEESEDDAPASRTLSISLLLSKNPTALSKRNKNGWSWLHIASFAGELECVEMLLKAGCNPNITCNDGCTALHYASSQGHINVCRCLVAAGAVVTTVDNDGDSPLDVAYDKKTKKVIKELLQRV